jgi:hypothetical protein
MRRNVCIPAKYRRRSQYRLDLPRATVERPNGKVHPAFGPVTGGVYLFKTTGRLVIRILDLPPDPVVTEQPWDREYHARNPAIC